MTMALTDPYFGQEPATNPLLYNWTFVYVRYCDGAYYSGDRADVLTGSTGRPLYFRGQCHTETHIQPTNSTSEASATPRHTSNPLTLLQRRTSSTFEQPATFPGPHTSMHGFKPHSATILGADMVGRFITEALVADLKGRHGLGHATHVVVAGCSAGAIHTFAHLDALRSLLPHVPSVAPYITSYAQVITSLPFFKPGVAVFFFVFCFFFSVGSSVQKNLDFEMCVCFCILHVAP